CADRSERAAASCSVSSRIWKFAACMEAYPERLMDHRSLSREAGTGRYQEIEDKRGVSGEGQATAESARARRCEIVSFWAPSLMAALPYHAGVFRSSAF